MKIAFVKGLGLKCPACHVQGEYDRDDKPEKEATRAFLSRVLGETSQEKRAAALNDLLFALKMKEPKDPTTLWAGIDILTKKR
jgi:hypothetical protein